MLFGDSEMDEAIIQAYARLTAHEFFLEIMYANWLAQMPEPQASQTASEIRNRMKRAYSAPNADPASAESYGLQIAQDASALADRFLDKVESRASEIRAGLSQVPARQD
jgi:hypothetical protein